MPSVLYCIYPPTFSNCVLRKDPTRLVEEGANIADDISFVADIVILPPPRAVSLLERLL